MPSQTVLNNVAVSAPATSPSVQITDRVAEANYELSWVAPASSATSFQAQIEVSDNTTGPWEIVHVMNGGGGPSSTGGVKTLVFAGGITPDMVGRRVRINVTAVSGAWRLTAILTT